MSRESRRAALRLAISRGFRMHLPSSRRMSDDVSVQTLQRRGFDCIAIHGDQTQARARPPSALMYF
eukprot:3237397-Pleurochrysis_carterae.AAC.2